MIAELKSLGIMMAVLFTAGAVFGNVFQNGVAFVGCRFCDAGKVVFVNSIRDVLASGQLNLKTGIDGLTRLRDDAAYTRGLYAIDPQVPKQQEALFKDNLKRGMIMFAITLAALFFTWDFIFKFFHFPAPAFLTLFLSGVSIALVSWLLTGATPFGSLVKILSNTDLWFVGAVDAVSPISVNVTQNLTEALGK